MNLDLGILYGIGFVAVCMIGLTIAYVLVSNIKEKEFEEDLGNILKSKWKEKQKLMNDIYQLKQENAKLLEIIDALTSRDDEEQD